MKKLFKLSRILLFIGLALCSIAIVLELYYLDHDTDIRRFEKSLRKKENEADTKTSIFNTKEGFKSFLKNKKDESTKDDIAYFLYEDKELVYWSNNLIDIPEVYEDSFFDQALLILNNGKYAIRNHSYQNIKVVALIPIFYEYNTTNKYLINDFHPDLKPLYESSLTDNPIEGYFISNKDGKYLFSILQSENISEDNPICIIISFLYLFGIIFLLGHALVRIKSIINFTHQLCYFFLIISILGVLRYISLTYELPSPLYSLKFFSPELHASSILYRSLGDFWINALFIFSAVYFFCSIKIPNAFLLKSKRRALVILGILMILDIALALYVFNQVESLVFNSSFSMQVHTGSGIKIYTIWAYGGAALLLSSALMFLRSLTVRFRKIITIDEYFMLWFLALLISSLVLLFIDRFLILHLLYLITIGILQSTVKYRSKKDYSYTLQVFTIIISAFYLTSLISIHSEEKERQIRYAQAISIKDSNQPMSKALLETMSNEWNQDNTLLSLFQKPIENQNEIKDYLLHEYFTKDWSQYNIQIDICAKDDEVETIDSDKFRYFNDCFVEYNKLITQARRIGNSFFYEINTYRGITPYLGVLSFITEDYGEVRMFVHLDLKPYEDEEGYPELLISKNRELDISKRYSFAKYINNRLRYSNGNFDYYSTFDNFKNDKKGNYFISIDGYNHYVHKVTDSYKIIVSEEELSFYEKYVAFPYIFFLLFFIFITVWSLETYPWYTFQYNSFRQQIKIVLISLITLVFIVVGGASLYFSYKSNRDQYAIDHNIKIQMLRRELFSNIESIRDLDPKTNPALLQRLKNYARIVDADINIYDKYGVLISTSQPEIFDNGIISNRMNYRALTQLNSHKTTEVTVQERLGNLEYSSVYVTIWNNKNEPIAYLNVPYFMKYKEFKDEMQNIIIGVLNINLLLIILAIIAAFAISQRITSPLVMLQDRFSKIRLGKDNEKIEYYRDDEIKSLVNAYNTMVEELEESTKLLTQSERKSAWREMARQVAHEIKNPLTPMKLNIQFLQRKMADGSDNWEEQFKKASNMLLKEIDELSAIASSFSDFAKMPTLKNEEVDLFQILDELISLYNKGDINLTLETKMESIIVYADPNRLRRAFINLITNAMQSIKEPENGKVEVYIQEKDNHFVEIAIKDNGRGIPDEIKPKIFTPSFTTKSSGMGLGLALTKDIINQADGIISFESEVGKGTIFRVTLPTIESRQ